MLTRVLVTQMGARHNYAVPRILHKHGILSRFYTDLCIKGVGGRAATKLLRKLESPVGGKLRRRTVEGIPPSLLFSAPMVNIRSALAFSSTPNERYRLENELFGQQMIKWGTGEANVVYAMYGTGMPFLRSARDRGLKVAADVFIAPLSHRTIARERELFPDWEDAMIETDSDRAMIDHHTREMIEVADLLLCPSYTVLDDLEVFASELSPQIATIPAAVVVPYGIPSGGRVALGGKGTAVPGRILFAGGAELRKGIHYLAKAAESLGKQRYEFRIAGQVTDRVRKHPAAGALAFLGHLSRERMLEEYAKADVFVLPTLAEGSATVVFEALAAGIPIVTTRSAGSVVTHGKEGLIVPERNSEALASAIERIVRDRALRDAMAEAAIATVANFGEGPWGGRLVEALAMLTPETASRPSTAMPPSRSPVDVANS